METERIALSQRERDRLRVLHEVKPKQLTQNEAARRMRFEALNGRHNRRDPNEEQDSGQSDIVNYS
jgi:hypothetical protein